MSSQSQAKSPEALRAMVAGTLANFQHPTLKHNLTTLKALHHVAWLDDTLHIELQMPFVWSTAFDALKEQTSSELLRITGAKAIDWKLSHSIATPTGEGVTTPMTFTRQRRIVIGGGALRIL